MNSVRKNLETWIISPRGEKRFLQGHPWVFSNEITNSLKTVAPGDLVRLSNTKDQTLALGYGNPHSLIAFRVLSPTLDTPDTSWLALRFLRAARFRQALGLVHDSHRLIFSEADALPGLIVDVFKTAEGQIFVFEILTAGMEKLLENNPAADIVQDFLKRAREEDLAYFPWEQTTLLLKKDGSFRKMENLPILENQIVGALDASQLSSQNILVARALDRKTSLTFQVDLLHGQKTGFFLDQRSNIELLLAHVPPFSGRPIRILDLFCYVGQWSAQIAAELQSHGLEVEVTAVDASQKALDLAEKNVRNFASAFHGQKMDIVEKCMELPQNHFDIVICDPPALIKSKKDHPAGKNAYTKINTAALRALKKDGLFISCSCSQHLSDEDLVDVLATAMSKARQNIAWIAKGQQGPDHPMRLEFPQGTYLNSWLGLAKAPTP